AALNRTGNPNILVSVTISGKITDALSGVDPSSAKYAVTDEYGVIHPSGSITLNPDGSYSFVVRLQATRDAKDKDGRVYSIKIDAKDKLGNAGSKTIRVIVT